MQRKELRESTVLHPLLERVMRIHVTEEARHLSFARSYLKSTIGSLNRWHRVRLGIGAPIILSIMAQMMLKPAPQLVRRHHIPRAVIAEAYTRNPAHKDESLASMRRVRKLCDDLGLLTPGYQRLWRLLGLHETTEDHDS